MDRHNVSEPINCGAGFDVSILELAEMVGRAAGFQGKLIFDTGKPDGTPRKLLDSSQLAALGWRPKTSSEEGIGEVYRWFADSQTVKPAVHPRPGDLQTNLLYHRDH